MTTQAGPLVAVVMLTTGLFCKLLRRCNEQVKGRLRRPGDLRAALTRGPQPPVDELGRIGRPHLGQPTFALRRSHPGSAPQGSSPKSPWSVPTSLLRLSISFFSSIILSSRPTVNRWNCSSSASRSSAVVCCWAIFSPEGGLGRTSNLRATSYPNRLRNNYLHLCEGWSSRVPSLKRRRPKPHSPKSSGPGSLPGRTCEGEEPRKDTGAPTALLD